MSDEKYRSEQPKPQAYDSNKPFSPCAVYGSIPGEIAVGRSRLTPLQHFRSAKVMNRNADDNQVLCGEPAVSWKRQESIFGKGWVSTQRRSRSVE